MYVLGRLVRFGGLMQVTSTCWAATHLTFIVRISNSVAWILHIIFRNDIHCSNMCLEQDCAAIYFEKDSNFCYLGVLVDKCQQVDGGIRVLTRPGKITGKLRQL